MEEAKKIVTPTMDRLGNLGMKEEISAPEVERNVIGALIGRRENFDGVQEIICEEMFSDIHLRNMYKAVESVVHKGSDPDIVAVYEELKSIDKMVEAYELAKICGDTTCHDLVYEVGILDTYRKKRTAYHCGLILASKAHLIEEDIDDVIGEVMNKLTDTSESGYAEDITMSEVMNELLSDVRMNAQEGVMHLGSRTGFRELDWKGGLKYSSLIVIAAESSQGKSSLALNLAINALTHGAKVAFYSLEMTNKELVSRVIASQSNISPSDLLYSKLMPEEIRKVEAQVNAMQSIGKNMHFDDRSESGIDTILSSIRSKKRKYNIDGVVLDYMQILNVNMRNANKEQAMGEVARKLKNIAKELNIWVIALSQLNRDNSNPIPTMNRLRDSGQIVEAADEVILIFRATEQNRVKEYPEPFQNVSTEGTALLIKAKGRNTGTKSFVVGFDSSRTTFFDLVDIPKRSGEAEEEYENPF